MNIQRGIAACMILMVVSTIVMPAYGERSMSFQRTVDVRKEFLLKSFIDYKNYPKIFPDNIKSASVVQINGQNVVEIQAIAGGITFDEQATYEIQPDGKYVLEIISGDLKGTRMISSLTSTWGFDGTLNGGTKVETDLTLQASGLASAGLIFIGDDQIKSAMDSAIYRFYQYARNIQDNQLASLRQSNNSQLNIQTLNSSNTTQSSQNANTNQVLPVAVSSYPATLISLQASSYSPSDGTVVVFSGKLSSSDGKPVQNDPVSVKMENPYWFDSTIGQTQTNSNGEFSFEWTSHWPHWYSNKGNFYAEFDGSANFSSSRSQDISISVQ